MTFTKIKDKPDLENTCISSNIVLHLARGNRNDNNTFHIAELQAFVQPYPVCIWPEVMLTA